MFTTNTDTMVLLNIPAGKPNRNATSPVRVQQPKQKSDTCFYYAYKTSAIQDPDYLTKQRENKRKYASEFRKSLSCLEGIISKVTSMVRTVGAMPKNQLLGFLTYQSTLNGSAPDALFSDIEKRFLKTNIIPGISSKTIQNITLQSLEEIRAENTIKASSDFLSKIGIDPNQTLIDITKISKQKLTATGHSDIAQQIGDPEKLPAIQKNVLLLKAVNQQMESIFELQTTTWKPDSPIELLMDLLKKNQSPIIFYGYFGKNFYTKGPINTTESITGYNVYGFPPNTHKPKAIEPGHTISVIGVKKNTTDTEPNGWVYYIDPVDLSEANQPRKIYKMSYPQFCNYCMDGIVNSMRDASDPHLKNLDYGAQRVMKH